MTTPTTPPTTEFNGPINDPATVTGGVIREGPQIPVEPQPERCLLGTGEFSYLPCTPGPNGEAVYVVAPETSIVAVAQPPLPMNLPDTGSELQMTGIGLVLVVVGVIITRLARRSFSA